MFFSKTEIIVQKLPATKIFRHQMCQSKNIQSSRQKSREQNFFTNAKSPKCLVPKIFSRTKNRLTKKPTCKVRHYLEMQTSQDKDDRN